MKREDRKAANAQFGTAWGAFLARHMDGKTVKQVAYDSGVTSAVLYRYLNGGAPTLMEALKILRGLGIKEMVVSELLSE